MPVLLNLMLHQGPRRINFIHAVPLLIGETEKAYGGNGKCEELLRENIETYKVSLLGYCLMSNHVHLIAAPELANGLALAFRKAHGRYAAYWNAIHGASGHAWQGRFYSCPLDKCSCGLLATLIRGNSVRPRKGSVPAKGPSPQRV